MRQVKRLDQQIKNRHKNKYVQNSEFGIQRHPKNSGTKRSIEELCIKPIFLNKVV